MFVVTDDLDVSVRNTVTFFSKKYACNSVQIKNITVSSHILCDLEGFLLDNKQIASASAYLILTRYLVQLNWQEPQQNKI